jgi:2-methylisocitrate lyase-like PEP mutase family enzyme
MPNLKTQLRGQSPVFAPVVFDPLSARLAEEAGFSALYLGGGTQGYLKCVTEANLTLTEMMRLGLDIRTVCTAPLILDGAGGWGDPMHMRRTIQMTEAAGFAAIEIEDQLQPKRAHHHIGLEHSIPAELMVAKIKEAVAARRHDDLVIIARTNTARREGLDEALRRGEQYRRAGADMLFVLPKTPDEVRIIGERLGAPLMYMLVGVGVASMEYSMSDLNGLGYRLVVDPTTPFLAAYASLRTAYRDMAAGKDDQIVSSAGGYKAIQSAIHQTIDLETLLDIERRSVERAGSKPSSE